MIRFPTLKVLKEDLKYIRIISLYYGLIVIYVFRGVETRDIKEFTLPEGYKELSLQFQSDLYRFFILYKYGGIYSDFDSIPLKKLDDNLYNYSYFSCYESSAVNEGNISGAIVGFIGAEERSEAVRNLIAMRVRLPYSIATMKLGLLIGDIEGVKILKESSFLAIPYDKILDIKNSVDSISLKELESSDSYELHLYHNTTNLDFIE